MPDPMHDVWATWFLGIQAIQIWADFQLWERLFDQHPELKGVVELGSLRGGFSMFLLLQSWAHGQTFDTFDTAPMEAANTLIGKRLDLASHHHFGDLFGAGQETLTNIFRDDAHHPLVLFCDNGDKKREFQTFVPMLRKGDLIACHDFGTEFNLSDVGPLEHLVKRIYEAECDAYDARTVFFERL